MLARRGLCCTVSTLAVILVGTVVVLSTVVSYFGVDSRDVVTQVEMRQLETWAAEAAAGYSFDDYERGEATSGTGGVRWDEGDADVADDEGRDVGVPRQRVPKIVHQTWKEERLPEKWEKVRQNCMELHPD